MTAISNTGRPLVGSMAKDFSISAVVAGLIAVTVSYAGPAVIIFQASNVAHLTMPQLSSWIWAISIGSGVTGVLLSWWFRVPVIIAWSTPGAALLVTSLTQFQYAEAIGAYLVAGAFITVLGVTGLFSKVMQRIPRTVVAAMLAGILFRFGTSLFTSLESAPTLVAPIAIAFMAGRRWHARYAVVAALATGLIVAGGLQMINLSAITISLATPEFTPPALSLSALVGLGIPLFFVTMTSQNAPGVGVMQTAGYHVPVSPLITTTGLASVLLAPFGAHGINLAAITAAICTGPEAHPDHGRRYIAGITCGLAYIVIGCFGTTVASVFASLPEALIASLAGLALLGTLGNSLAGALHNEESREAGVITFLITASGVAFFGVGSAFWGLLGGVASHWMLHSKSLPQRSQGTTTYRAKA